MDSNIILKILIIDSSMMSSEASWLEATSLEAVFRQELKIISRLRELKFQKIKSRLTLQKTRRVRQRPIWKDLKALDACSLKSVEKGQLYEVYNHYLHYSVCVSASRKE